MTVEFKSLLGKKAKFRSLDPRGRKKAEVKKVWPLLLALAADDVPAFDKEFCTFGMDCSSMVFKCDSWGDEWHDMLMLATKAEAWHCLLHIAHCFGREGAITPIADAIWDARMAIDYPTVENGEKVATALAVLFMGQLKNHMTSGQGMLPPLLSWHFPKSSDYLCEIFGQKIECWAKDSDEALLVEHYKAMMNAVRTDDQRAFRKGLYRLTAALSTLGRTPAGWLGSDMMMFMGKTLTTFGAYKCHEEFWDTLFLMMPNEELRAKAAMAYAFAFVNEKVDDNSPNAARLEVAVSAVFNELLSIVGKEGRAMVLDYAAENAWTERIVAKAISKANADELHGTLEECTFDPNTSSIGTRASSGMRI